MEYIPGYLTDPALSLKAKGAFSVMLGTGHCKQLELTRLTSNGKDCVSTAMHELIDAGYVTRTRARSEQGYPTYRYTLYADGAADEVAA